MADTPWYSIWISQISLGESSNGTPDMYETVIFQLEKESSPVCRQHAHDILSSLRQSAPWAVKMYDSGGKFPRGIITSVSHHAGNYYDCTDVERISKKAETFQGQYCVVPLEIYEGESTNEAEPHSSCDKCSFNEDQKQKFQNSTQQIIMGNHLWMGQQKIFWALCIPSTCSHIDLRIAMNKVLADFNTRKNLLISATLKDIDCSTQQKKTRSMHGDIFFSIIACLCIICMTSTIYDWYIQQNSTTNGGERPGLLANTLLSFSLKKNYKELVHEPSKSDGMRVLYGLRVISAILIIAFHRMLFTNFTNLINPDFMILNRNKLIIMFLRSGEMAVDTFFAISAFLHMYSMLRQPGKFSFLKHMFKRYMRLTPVAIFAIVTEIVMIDCMMNYPLWMYARHKIQRPCSENWIPNILYVSNFEGVDDMCLVNAWYLGADMQLYILSIPVILLVVKYPSVAKYIFGVLAFVSISVPFAVSLNTGVHPVLLAIIDKNVHPLVRAHAEILYWPTYCRAGAYIVGLVAGFLYYQMKLKNYKFSKMLSHSSLMFSFICCFGPLYYSTLFHNKEYSYSPLESALFASTNRFLWGVGVSILILNISTQAEGFLHNFLGNRYFIILGKLTYSSLMANLVINVWFLLLEQQPIYLSFSYYVSNSILDVIFTYLLGIFIYLIIEQPFRNLSELIWSGFKMKHNSVESTRKSE